MQKIVLGQTEFSKSNLVSREAVVNLFESSEDFAGEIESQNIPYVVWHDDKSHIFYMLIPTADGVCKVEFERSEIEGRTGYDFYLSFADGLANTAFDHYKGTQCFFGTEVDFYAKRVNSEKAA
ncbi:hypothetical protein [Dethiobacter alkaliphilus]|uniref:Uncharacterized protein n=1 Tax=Dethiobacter alkaliphilus AHT 1 TaxID=555088 RepID=C0GD98_DETAL|nr:hypothetical protein [Dethiobacter alkaliphilus]EEG78619.1 hypothetical protein DealDRAFT_0549 [Dethiobacter alkaliphilus AHT 1]MCW3489739.1 hypothetical protein [Dethiobacter alkaliphilus]